MRALLPSCAGGSGALPQTLAPWRSAGLGDTLFMAQWEADTRPYRPYKIPESPGPLHLENGVPESRIGCLSYTSVELRLPQRNTKEPLPRGKGWSSSQNGAQAQHGHERAQWVLHLSACSRLWPLPEAAFLSSCFQVGFCQLCFPVILQDEVPVILLENGILFSLQCVLMHPL